MPRDWILDMKEAVSCRTRRCCSILEIPTSKLTFYPYYSAEPKDAVLNDFKASANVQGQQNPELNSRTICISALFVDVISETAWGLEGHLTSAAHIHRLLEFLNSYGTEEDKFK